MDTLRPMVTCDQCTPSLIRAKIAWIKNGKNDFLRLDFCDHHSYQLEKKLKEQGFTAHQID